MSVSKRQSQTSTAIFVIDFKALSLVSLKASAFFFFTLKFPSFLVACMTVQTYTTSVLRENLNELAGCELL